MSEAIKMVRFQKRKHCSPCCFNSAPVFHLMPCAFGVNLADGDGVQDHLLPVCEDDACQRSTIYLSKSGSTEVLCVHREFTPFSVHSLLFASFSSLFVLFFFFCSPFKSLSTSYICCTSLSSSQHIHVKKTPVESRKMQYHYFSNNSVTESKKSDRLLCKFSFISHSQK